MDKPKPSLSGHIYLLREREFIRLEEDTYKIGKTTQSLRRFKGYPHDSHILIVLEVDLVTKTETRLIRLFKKTFEHRPQYGNEYFTGDPREMKRLIITECCADLSYVLMNRAKTKSEPVSVGILTKLFQGLGLYNGENSKDVPNNKLMPSLHESESDEPIGYFIDESLPKTLSDAVSMFIKYIKDIQPIWYVDGAYIPSDRILEEFIYITGFDTTLSALSKQLNGVLYNDKKRQKIDGRSMTIYKLINVTNLKSK